MSLLNQYPCVSVSAPAYLSFATASFALLTGVVASVGNLLVVLAVFLDPHKELRSSFSYFVASLGFADLMVGLFAAPMGAVYPITAGLQRASQRFSVWMHLVYFISCTASLLLFDCIGSGTLLGNHVSTILQIKAEFSPSCLCLCCGLDHLNSCDTSVFLCRLQQVSLCFCQHRSCPNLNCSNIH